MRLLGLGQGLEPVGDLIEALVTRSASHSRVHVGVLEGLTSNGGSEVGFRLADGKTRGRIADFLDVVKVAVCVTSLALCGVAEESGDLGVALDVGDLCARRLRTRSAR